MINDGDRIGRLTIVRASDQRYGGHKAYICRCDCGKLCIKRADTLSDAKLRNQPIACGCKRGTTSKRKEYYYYYPMEFILESNMYIHRTTHATFQVIISINNKRINKSFGTFGEAKSYRNRLIKAIYKELERKVE